MEQNRKPKYIHIHRQTDILKYIHTYIYTYDKNSRGKINSIMVRAYLGSHLKKSKIESIPHIIH